MYIYVYIYVYKVIHLEATLIMLVPEIFIELPK